MSDGIGGHIVRVPLTYAYNEAQDLLIRAAVALAALPSANGSAQRDNLAQTAVNHIFNAAMIQARQEHEDRRLINRLIGWWKK